MKDVIYTILTIVVIIGSIAGITYYLMKDEPHPMSYPCDHYQNWQLRDIPVRCIAYFNDAGCKQ